MSERLIVIGGGGAGTAAATIAKRLNPDLKVTLFTEFPDIAYSPCGIPFVHGREIAEVRGPVPLHRRALHRGRARHADGDDGHRHRPRPRHGHRPQHPRGLRQAGRSAPASRGRSPTSRARTSTGLHYVKDIRAAMEFDKELDGHEARRRCIGATPLGVEMAGNLGHRGLAGRLRRRGPVGAVRGARPRRRRAGARVAREARRDAAAGHAASRASSAATAACGAVATSAGELRVRRRDRLPAQAPQQRARRGGRASRPARPAAIVVDEHMRTSRPSVWAAGDVVEVPHGLSMIPIRGLTGSHAYAQGRTAAFNAAGQRPRLRPGVGPVGDGGRRLHDRRLLDRRDARDRDGRPVRRGQGRRRLARPLLPGRDAHARQAARRAGHAEAHRRPDPRRRGRQGARGLPRLRGQARRDARRHRVDGEHLLAADRRAVRADGDRRPERPGGAARERRVAA